MRVKACLWGADPNGPAPPLSRHTATLPACLGPSQALPRGLGACAAAAATDGPRPALLPPSGSWARLKPRNRAPPGVERTVEPAWGTGFYSGSVTPKERRPPLLNSQCSLLMEEDTCPRVPARESHQSRSWRSLGHYGQTAGETAGACLPHLLSPSLPTLGSSCHVTALSLCSFLLFWLRWFG